MERPGTKQARQLRRTPTDAETRLWRYLKNRNLEGWKFRRQAPIGPYVADFFCPDAKLIIEADGGQHALEVARDARRTRWLESEGYRVIRFWNNDILSNTDGVLTVILEALSATPHPNALP
ncbi:endonuclease domain-containing protein [Hyphobacterium marinum]|uniref:Endonuclease domain-containing protein n=1 Tax=Hyphobacterium marinum TaxID=3116574 RepID=A0ABU7M2E9_9PROT|nr:endonuclease domain-containing protein [Hyphobacterium sp. Y6023]MEE2567450.1 endonuclease domain-containing protein [Hyphobacterium sp. Y6023]